MWNHQANVARFIEKSVPSSYASLMYKIRSGVCTFDRDPPKILVTPLSVSYPTGIKVLEGIQMDKPRNVIHESLRNPIMQGLKRAVDDRATNELRYD